MSKFKNTEELEKAYKELEKEFTKKSQRLAHAEKTIEIQKITNDALIDENLDYRYNITDTAFEQAKEMAKRWEEDYQQEIVELKSQLALTEKALELACEDISSLYREKKLKARTKLVLTCEPFGFMNLKEHFYKEAKEMKNE